MTLAIVSGAVAQQTGIVTEFLPGAGSFTRHQGTLML